MELLNNDELVGTSLDMIFSLEPMFSHSKTISSLAPSTVTNNTTDASDDLDNGALSLITEIDIDCEQIESIESMIQEHVPGLNLIHALDDEWGLFSSNSNSKPQQAQLDCTVDNAFFATNVRSPGSPSVRIYSQSKAITECNRRCHGKTLSLASPLQMPDEDAYIMPTGPLQERRKNPETNEYKDKRSTSIKRGSLYAKSFNGKDIFTYNFSNNKMHQAPSKIYKPSRGSHHYSKPPLKPSVTITSIDTLKQSQQSPRPLKNVKTPQHEPRQTSAPGATTIIQVGNPFYKPFHKSANKTTEKGIPFPDQT
ncbi:hypothetical protein KGF57_000494 [Candida theae]|uniref:Uncharacterized protein n=1 Tax=Candida theae TaxID=1198502 RepID=A0AAD5BIT4_9ASCO|nr:uncharacterized protein KGF57_000494 [Candida theae]KAI5967066.1 hypothetical protein KGF57_000494 [Candida theae]